MEMGGAQPNTIPIFQFAFFYNNLLEFTACSPLTVNGPVHANGDIYVGSILPLVFNGRVSLTGSVIVTNKATVLLLVSNSTVTVTLKTSPFITIPPQACAVIAGQDAAFSVSAIGDQPLSCQRQVNGGNIASATNSSFTVTSASLGDQGDYQVVITNPAGMLTSPAAALSVYTAAAPILGAPAFFSGGDSFRLSLTGVPGFNYIVEASTNLVDWVPLATNTSPFVFRDGEAANVPVRYYRAIYLP